jgi:hypothetical protein
MTAELTAARPALTTFSDEETMFRDAVASFAEEEVRPRVRQMEQAAKLDPTLVPKYFEMGLMGIEVGEQYGGAGGSLTMVTIAVEEISKVDASAAIMVDVQNTLVNYPINRYGSEAQKAKYLSRLTSAAVGAYALSEPGSGSDAFGMATRATRADGGWRLDGSKLWITNGAEAETFVVFANTDPSQGYRGITAFLVERGFEGFAVGKKEDKLGIRASSTVALHFESVFVPDANVLGEVGKGYKIAIETLNEGRIGIGVPQGAPAVRQGARRVPGDPVPGGAGGHGAGGGAADGVQRLAPQGRGARHREGRRDGEAVREPGVRARDVAVRGAVRRLRVREGVPRGEVLPRREDRDDLRGDVEHAAADDREGGAEIARHEGRGERHEGLARGVVILSAAKDLLRVEWILRRFTPLHGTVEVTSCPHPRASSLEHPAPRPCAPPHTP